MLAKFSLNVAMLFLSIYFSSAYAAVFYRHIPFSLTLNKGDVVYVDYDFSEKIAVNCTAAQNAININFLYKGNQKTGQLPIILESDHVPEKTVEELADVSGQFSVTPDAPITSSKTVSCQYN